MSLILKLLAPYLAVAVFWCGFSNAWLAILAYHVQVLLWSRCSLPRMRGPAKRRDLLLALPTVVTGLLLYFLLPHITHTDFSTWLTDHRLTGIAFLIMIPYFGFVHPYLEQAHWGPLRKRTALAHPLFAGYHLLVLFSLLSVGWLVLCFVVLTAASYLWQKISEQTGDLTVATVSHVLADLGVVVAAWVSVSG